MSKPPSAGAVGKVSSLITVSNALVGEHVPWLESSPLQPTKVIAIAISGYFMLVR